MRPAFGVVAALAFGCAHERPPESTSMPSATPIAPVVATSSKCEAPNASPPSERDVAIELYAVGRYREALQHLTERLREAPWDRVATVLRTSVMTHLLDHIPRSSEPQRRVRLGEIPEALRVPPAVAVPTQAAPLTLVQGLATPPPTGLLESLFDWASERGVVLSESMIDIELRRRGRTADERRPDRFGHDDHLLQVLGAWSKVPGIALSSNGVLETVYDTTSITRDGAAIAFAERAYGALIVQTSCPSCPPAERGRVYAFDANDGAFRWTTPPGVGGHADFLRVDGALVVASDVARGEAPNVHVVDVATGEVRQTTPVKELPTVLARRGDRLFAKTNLGGEAAWRLSRSEIPRLGTSERACRLRARAADLDAARGVEVTRAYDAFANEAAGDDRALREAVQERPRIDLAALRPTVVAPPPWEARVETALGGVAGPKPLRLVRTRTTKLPDMFDRPLELGGHFNIAPVWYGRLPSGAPPALPTQYGVHDLRHVLTHDAEPGRVLAVYGERYVHVIEGDAATRIFDMAAFLVPPKIGGHGAFVPHDITGLALDRGTLFVCNGGGSYASESFGKKGFITALDVASGKLQWRSAPLACGADVLVWGEYLITGYGFTDEPDFVNVLRRRDGKMVTRVPLDKAPSSLFIEDGKTLVVHTYDSEVRFEIRE